MLKTLGVALTSGLVGAGVALLLAPRSGRDTRKMINRSLEQQKRAFAKKLNRETDRMLRKGRAAMEDVSGFVQEELQAAQLRISKVVSI
jgi:gas vesicle protein